MHSQSALVTALDDYLRQLAQAGAIAPKLLRANTDAAAIDALNTIEKVTLPDELRAYLLRVDGYDSERCDEYDVYQPEFAWQMHPLAATDIPAQYECCLACGDGDDDTYWPQGFLPILWGGSGDYVVVNCIAGSPTYGAVYDMSEGVGCNRITASLAEFLTNYGRELAAGLRRFDDKEFSSVVDVTTNLQSCAVIYDRTPYFNRIGKMGSQIVDWK